MRRRVVITGLGVITPLGDTVDQLFKAQVAGKSGVGYVETFDASAFPTKIAAQVKNFELARYVKDASRWQSSGPNSRFGAAATQLAMQDAGLLDNKQIDRTRFGTYLGAGEGKQDFDSFISLIGRSYAEEKHAVDTRRFTELGQRDLHTEKEREQEPHMLSAHLSAYFDLQGPNYACLTACAAGSQAVGEAMEWIREGEADLMLAGGAHSMIHPFGVTGFNLLTALSMNNADPTKASCPFDARRDGFVLGEGAGMMILEELEHAKKRGAKIYAEVTGYGSTADAYRMTDCPPDGRGAIACMKMALKDAGLKPEAIGYVNAHGTSTHVNDKCETIAIKQTFGDHAYRLPISSSKSMLGHLIAAAGAVELIIAVMALREGVIPPTINYEVPDPECDLDYVPNVAREARFDHALSNSFGFGGQNVSIIVSRFAA